MKRYGSFTEAISTTKFEIYKNSEVVASKTWQSIDVTKRPEMVTHEVKWWGFSVAVDHANLSVHAKDIAPNIPWTDDHFLERVSGYPLNPGLQWSHWPWASSADKFRKNGMFNHTYAERYFPKYATRYGPIVTDDEAEAMKPPVTQNWGIRYAYGDLDDVLNQLHKDQLTRQAILPVFFPEDTGAVHGDRVPCSIFYQFMIRNGKLDIFYYLRSCDFVRHFRDDIYLTLRLQLWVIDQLNARGDDIKPALFLMQTGSLHVFTNDWMPLFNKPHPKAKS